MGGRCGIVVFSLKYGIHRRRDSSYFSLFSFLLSENCFVWSYNFWIGCIDLNIYDRGYVSSS